MEIERRQITLENILTELGMVKALDEMNLSKVTKLEEHVRVQNGRISKVENWQTFLQGALTVLIILVLPIAFQISQRIITNLGFK